MDSTFMLHEGSESVRNIKSHPRALVFWLRIYKLDISNEVLYTVVGQEATKIRKVKVGFQKENYQLGQIRY